MRDEVTRLRLLQEGLFFRFLLTIHNHIAFGVATELVDYVMVSLELVKVLLHEFDVLFIARDSTPLHSIVLYLASHQINGYLVQRGLFGEAKRGDNQEHLIVGVQLLVRGLLHNILGKVYRVGFELIGTFVTPKHVL